jgi:hypothetical protein
MLRALFFRRPPIRPAASSRSLAGGVVATRPPHPGAERTWTSRLGGWLGASGWRVSRIDFASSFGASHRLDALAEARLDFADALCDVHSVAAAAALDRIAVARSLHELWHLRGELFDLISLRHDQVEAAGRLGELDRHFAKRSRLPRWRDAGSTGAAKR